MYRVLYDWILANINVDNKNENFFDIIADTSIGAINGAIIVSYVKEKKNADTAKIHYLSEYWHSSADVLEDFWIDRIGRGKTCAV